MNVLHRLALLLPPLLLAACAATTPVPKDFPADARTPSAAELTALLRGKSFDIVDSQGQTIRAHYAAASNDVEIFSSGRSDHGTWRAEDGRVCHEFRTFPASCSEYRLIGEDLYLKRASGTMARMLVR